MRVLVVDDSKVHVSIVSVYLMKLGVELDLAPDPDTALACFARNRPDLVVTDYTMPGMNGLELAKIIKDDSDGAVRVVLISGEPDLDVSAAREDGLIDAFLSKPLDGEKLAEAVDRLLTRKRKARPSFVQLPKVRVLIADDTRVGQRLLSRAVTADRDMELVGIAKDGAEAVEMTRTKSPDVVLLDPVLPVLDTQLATGRIMAESPTRVVIVTDEQSPQIAQAAYSATMAGAVDVIAKPRWSDLGSDALTSFHERIKELAEVPVIGQSGRVGGVKRRKPAGALHALPKARVIAICGSTGAPSVLAELLGGARAAVARVPVVAVQHVLEGFENTFAEWLSETAGVDVRVAKDGDELVPGRVLLAPGDGHLVLVSDKHVAVSHEPPVGSHRPSGTPLFESVTEHVGAGGVGVVLSGLGEDGVAGLAGLRSVGGPVLVQTPETCVAPSMPESAIRANQVDRVLPPVELARQLLLMTRPGSED